MNMKPSQYQLPLIPLVLRQSSHQAPLLLLLVTRNLSYLLKLYYMSLMGRDLIIFILYSLAWDLMCSRHSVFAVMPLLSPGRSLDFTAS